MKTVTKKLKVKTPKTTKNQSVKTAFYTTVKNLREEYKEQWKV